jgi:L-amino acid N-acyltransferase YncA
MNIRKATAADCPQIMKLIQELADYEKAPDEVTVSLEHFIESGFGEKPVWEAFVATSPQPSPFQGEGTVVGFALYYIRYSTWKGQRMYLEDLLVTDSMRGKGIGKLLFDALIDECKAKKYSGLVWQVLDWNKPAINFYKKFDGVKFDSEWVNCSLNF